MSNFLHSCHPCKIARLTSASAGFSCLTGTGAGCSNAPLLAPAYVFCNLGFNVALLNLLRASTSVIQSLTLSSLVPITIGVFTLNLPYLDDPPQLGPNFVVGSVILSLGLLVYNSNKFLPALQEKLGGKWTILPTWLLPHSSSVLPHECVFGGTIYRPLKGTACTRWTLHGSS